MPFSCRIAGLLLAFVVGSFVVGCERVGDTSGYDSSEISLIQAERHSSLELLQFRAVALDWVDDTTVAVIDRDDQQVVLLGLVGGSERRGAGRGGGPGELEGAFSLLGGAGGAVVVGDMNQNRVSHFDAGLEFVRSVQVPGMPLGLLAWDADRVIALWLEFVFVDGGMSPEPTVGVVDLDAGEVEARFSLFAPGSGLNRPETDNPFAPPFISAVRGPGGLILAGQSMEYRIAALDSSGIMQRSLGRPELGEQYLSSEETADERTRRGRTVRGDGPLPAEMGGMLDDALDAPQPYFGPNAFSVDPSGRLWVITERMRGDSTEVDVFEGEGEFLQTVALRNRVAALSFREQRVVALVARTAPEVEGVQGIDVYELQQ
jgi:hypothetical protein